MDFVSNIQDSLNQMVEGVISVLKTVITVIASLVTVVFVVALVYFSLKMMADFLSNRGNDIWADYGAKILGLLAVTIFAGLVAAWSLF